MPTGTSLVMSLLFKVFKLSAYALLALTSAALLAVLERRLRQRSLRKISGPSNPSLVWGKIHGLERTGCMLKWIGHWRHMFNPYAYVFYEGLYKTYGKVARLYGFFGVGPIGSDF